MLRRTGIKVSEPNGPLVGLASLLAIGFVIGLLGGWIWSRTGQEGIREDDYLVMVSLLYDRERSIPNTQERLAILDNGDVVQSISSLAESYPKAHPEAQTEARALRQLAAALGKSTDAKSQKVSPDRVAEGESGGIWLWLGIALVFVCFLGIGGPFALRFANGNKRGFVLPWSRSQRRTSVLLDPRALKRPTVSSGPPRTLTRMRQARGEESKMLSEDIDAAARLTKLPAEIHFISRYQFGEDPFDEVHPVADKMSGTLLGACGFSAELKLSEDSPGRYYAFSVWAHDYSGGDKLKAIGIVSKWAKSKAPGELVRWADTGKVDEVVVANPGMRLPIDTANLAIDVNIMSFRYANSVETPPESYFESLSVSFDVKVKHMAEV